MCNSAQLKLNCRVRVDFLWHLFLRVLLNSTFSFFDIELSNNGAKLFVKLDFLYKQNIQEKIIYIQLFTQEKPTENKHI